MSIHLEMVVIRFRKQLKRSMTLYDTTNQMNEWVINTIESVFRDTYYNQHARRRKYPLRES